MWYPGCPSNRVDIYTSCLLPRLPAEVRKPWLPFLSLTNLQPDSATIPPLANHSYTSLGNCYCHEVFRRGGAKPQLRKLRTQNTTAGNPTSDKRTSCAARL